MTILTVLHDIAPKFTNNTVNLRFIDYAIPQVSVSMFGASYELAVAYLTAHILEVANRANISGGLAGIVSSVREGERAVGFTNPTINDVDLMTTSYGVEFVRLRKMYAIPVMVTSYGDGSGCYR